MKRWVMAAKRADFDALADRYHISPMLARIVRNRDVIGDEAVDLFLNGSAKDMHDSVLLTDIDIAADRIISAISNNEKIRIIGDYDIDGICSSYILKKSILLLGGDVDVKLPDRIADGYGLNRNLIDRAALDNVNLIVTCDNGIAAYSEIEYAGTIGVDVVVTDHHEVPYVIEDDCKRFVLPPAVAVVDPKREDCDYPFEGICGAMVAYKLIVYITSNWSRFLSYPNMDKLNIDMLFDESAMNELLIFAAIATVGDVMELLDENRIAVKHGLPAIAQCDNVGLRALIEVTGLDRSCISPYQVGFVLGPCMNATGRLDTAERALKLFFEDDYENAVVIAGELKELNENRKNMTLMHSEEAIELAGGEPFVDNKVLVIFLPECHESLAGIVAGRVREKYYKPTIVLTRSAEGVKGSGRSIEDYNMFEELSKVKNLFTKFGGHKMAAGLSMSEDDIDTLRERLNSECRLSDDELTEKYVIDIPLPVGFATIDFARELDKLAPFGVGNPKPLFAQKNVRFDNLLLAGKNQNVLKMKLYGVNASGNSVKVDGILFDNAAESFNMLSGRDEISILYQIDINSYKGRENVQLVIKDWY